MKRALGIGSLGLAALALAGLHPSARADIPPRPREVIAKPAAPSASAAPAASAGSAAPVATTPAPPKEVVAVKDYAWPTDESPEPSEEDWAGATDLGSRSIDLRRMSWEGGREVLCRQYAIRAWVRVVCTPIQPKRDPVFFGVVWGRAGELSSVKARFLMAHESDAFKAFPKNKIEELTQRMGVDATITFQGRPGQSMLLGIDLIGWDFNYDGGANPFSRPGMLVDVSWAKGEKAPTIVYR